MSKSIANLRIPNKARFIAHTPSGSIGACERHANELIKVFSAMGCHVSIEEIESKEPCINCVNEIKKEK